jgi:CBS domain containing-hemolysin-like protein
VSTRFGVSLLLAAAIALGRALLAAVDGAAARVPLVRARELAESSSAGRALLALKRAREIRLSLVSFALELLLLVTALVAAFAPQEGWSPRPLVSALLGIGAAIIAIWIELFLRALAQARPERWALLWATPLRVLISPLIPVWLLTVTGIDRIARVFGGVRPERAEPMPSLEEIEAYLSAEAAQGRIGRADPELLRSLLDFSDKTAREVMIPRTQVVGLELNAPIDEVVRVISEDGHTRVPVYRDTLDDIVGILHARDLVPLLANPSLIRTQDLIRLAFFVPWSRRIGSVLREMQRRHSHIAAVVDEYGGVMGIVTLEDILAEIVGELGSETGGDEGPPVERLVDGSALVRATISRDEFAEAFGVPLPGDAAETLAGWLNQRAGAIPELGDRFVVEGGLVLQVTERSPTQVRRVRVSSRKGA